MTTIKGDKSVGQSSHINLINDDCLIAMHDIADGSIDMILCDLPYG
jgi:DNA modification methylase